LLFIMKELSLIGLFGSNWVNTWGRHLRTPRAVCSGLLCRCSLPVSTEREREREGGGRKTGDWRSFVRVILCYMSV
jgi:hypothetical protein